jgi:hypothetical protein
MDTIFATYMLDGAHPNNHLCQTKKKYNNIWIEDKRATTKNHVFNLTLKEGLRKNNIVLEIHIYELNRIESDKYVIWVD